MTNAKIDGNWKPTLIGVRSTDGDTPIRAEIDPVSGGLLVDIVAGGSSGNVNLTQVGGSNISLGQTTKSASLPVTLASDQGTLAVQDSAAESSLSTIATNTTALSTSANQTNGTQQTKVTDGTNVANVLAPGTAISTSNALLTASTSMSATFSVTSVTAGTVYDVGNYRWVSVHIVTQYTGTTPTIAFQISNDNANWVACGLIDTSSGGTTSSSSNTTAAGRIFAGPIPGRYFRLNFTGTYSSGTATGTILFSSLPSAQGSIGTVATQTGTWTVQPGNTANTTAWLMAGSKINNNAAPGATNLGSLIGVANAAAPSYIEGNEVLVSTDLSGNLRTIATGGLMPTGTALNTYSVHLTSNTTTTPTPSTAYISSISISNEVGGTTSTVTIQDKQGTPLKLINGFATTALTTTPTTVNFQTPAKMVSGIDIVTAGAVAATIDVWINYYQ